MSKTDKLLKDLENNPYNVRFETLKNLLENAGYRAINNGSSHWQFRKENKETLTIPYKRPVKAVYIKQVLKALKDSEWKICNIT